MNILGVNDISRIVEISEYIAPFYPGSEINEIDALFERSGKHSSAPTGSADTDTEAARAAGFSEWRISAV